MPPLSKTNGSPELEAHDALALADFLGEQDADGFLVERTRRGRADVDLLGVGASEPQQARRNAVVVDHDVGAFEIAPAAHADQRRVAGAGADDVHARLVHDVEQSCPGSVSRRSGRARAWCRSPWPPRATRRCRELRPRRHDVRRATPRRLERRARRAAISANTPSGSWHPPPSATTTACSAASADPRRHIVHGCHSSIRPLVVSPDLYRDDALAGRRHAPFDGQAGGDPVAEPQPAQPGGGEDQGIACLRRRASSAACRRFHGSLRTVHPDMSARNCATRRGLLVAIRGVSPRREVTEAGLKSCAT